MVEPRNCSFGKGETTLIRIVEGPKKCRKGCRCEKIDKRKLCRHGKEARGMDRLECNMDMESRRQEYYRA